MWCRVKPGEAQGRISGSEAWKRARGEDGGRGGQAAAGGEEEAEASCAVPGLGSGGSADYLQGFQLHSYVRLGQTQPPTHPQAGRDWQAGPRP